MVTTPAYREITGNREHPSQITTEQLAEATKIVRLALIQEQKREKKTTYTKHQGFVQTPRNLVRGTGIFTNIEAKDRQILTGIIDLYNERRQPIHESYENLSKILNIPHSTLNRRVPDLINHKYLLAEKKKTSNGHEVLCLVPNLDWIWKDNDALYGKPESEHSFFCASQSSQNEMVTIPNRDEHHKMRRAQNVVDHPKMRSTKDTKILNTNRDKEEERTLHSQGGKKETSSSCPSIEKKSSLPGSRQDEEQKESLQDYPQETITLAKEVAELLGFSHVNPAMMQFVHETHKEYPEFDMVYAAKDEIAYHSNHRNGKLLFPMYQATCQRQIKYAGLIPVSAGPVLSPAGSIPVSPAVASSPSSSSPVSSSSAVLEGGRTQEEIEQLCLMIDEQCETLGLKMRTLMLNPGSQSDIVGWSIAFRWPEDKNWTILTTSLEWESLLANKQGEGA